MADLDPFNWERCDHSGIGQPGCPTCDPDKGRCLLRANYIHAKAMTEMEARFAALRDVLEYEKKDHLATMKRWFGMHDALARSIAKARKLIRDSQYGASGHDDLNAVYRALDWRSR